MTLEHIERFVRAGWTLEVTPRHSRFHASVTCLRWDGHNSLGDTMPEALVRLNAYVADLSERPTAPTGAEPR